MGLSNLVSQIFVQNQKGRQAVGSLTPFLRKSLESNNKMEAEQMREEDRKTCRWVGFGFAKGVTKVTSDELISVLSTYPESVSTLHGLLIQGFSGVDEYPWCYYAEDASPGFGAFVRWAYFADPHGKQDVLALDYDPSANANIGKARSLQQVSLIAEICIRHGVPAEAELVLANPHMCEDENCWQMRLEKGLITLRDWSIIQ